MEAELHIVNEMLAAIGEVPVDTLEGSHPEVATCLRIMRSQRRKMLKRGWWFNTFERTFYPNPDGFILIPDNVLSFKPKEDVWGILANRDGKLYNMTDDTNLWSEQVTLIVVLDCPEYDVPPAAYDSIELHSVLDFVIKRQITGQQVDKVNNDLDMAQRELLAEELRHRPVDLTTTRFRKNLGYTQRAYPHGRTRYQGG